MALRFKKKALGKGLAELIPELDEKESKSVDKSEAITELPTEAITFFSLQPRITFREDESFEELVKSIEEKGIIQPIVVRKITDELYECVAGERRLRAAKKLGLAKVPVIIRELNDEEALLISIMENLQRKDLNPMEIAYAYKNLIERFNLTQEEIAERVGKDRATVANTLRLLKLPERIQEDLLEERLTMGHCKALLSLPSEELQMKARDIILEKALSVRETERLVASFLRERPKRKEKEIDEDLKALADEVSKLIGAPVEVKMKGNKTYFVFCFSDLESAESFLEKLKKFERN